MSHRREMLSFMLIDAARRAETAAKEMLACVNGGSASSSEMREALKISKAIVAVTSAFQAGAAATIANCERHGDGGAQVLADAAGLSRREAHGQVRAARTIEAAPAARDALGEGRVSLANAKRLAEAVERTSAAEVDADWELLAKAELMGPEQFAREARRWAAERQPDGGEGDYRQMRARRFVRIWDTDDGMVRFDGQFDPVTGRRIGNRLQADARRQYKLDKQDCVDGANERRSFKQCMADALDNLTANTGSSAGKPFADIAVVAHVDDETGRLVAEIAGGDPLPESVLEELMGNAALTGVIYSTDGTPLWQGHTKRTATAAQKKALIARYGGCFHCAAHSAMCQAHHIKPVSQGGPTNIDNMVLICWDCHNKVHHRGWQIRSRNGQHTLHPPDRTHHGPAQAPEALILHRAGNQRALDLASPRPSDIGHQPGVTVSEARSRRGAESRTTLPGLRGPAVALAVLLNAGAGCEGSSCTDPARAGPTGPPLSSGCSRDLQGQFFRS